MNKILTHYLCEELFGKFCKIKDLLVPSTYITTNADVVIQDLIKEFDSNNAICYSAFLNMVYQTQGVDAVCLFTANNFKFLNVTPIKNKDGILFHRTNLLYLSALIILKDTSGNKLANGMTNKQGAIDYLKSLAVVNNKLNSIEGSKLENLLISMLRDHPYSYSVGTTINFYQRWLKRYWYIYNDILRNLPDSNMSHIKDAIKKLEETLGITLKEYFFVISKLYAWFLFLPSEKNTYNSSFNINNHNSFYIDKNKFSPNSKLIKLIESISLDLGKFKNYIQESLKRDQKKERNFGELYAYSNTFFQKPFFKISNDLFCIIDLKFMIESVCSGFLWQLDEIGITEFKRLKAQYGMLVERYFDKLINDLFVKEQQMFKLNPDAIIMVEDYIIIFEFTTEYYRMQSLYNHKLEDINTDLTKILFNTEEAKVGGKKDKGKFIKLDSYVQEYTRNDKFKIIPILITEKLLGDCELLNNFDNFISENISNHNLVNLKKYPPIIMTLDDLELFWSFSSNDKINNAKFFIEKMDAWFISEKGKYHFNFSFFLHDTCKSDAVLNPDYVNFFALKKLISELSDAE